MTFLYNLVCPCKINEDNQKLVIQWEGSLGSTWALWQVKWVEKTWYEQMTIIIIKQAKLESNQTKSLIPIFWGTPCIYMSNIWRSSIQFEMLSDRSCWMEESLCPADSSHYDDSNDTKNKAKKLISQSIMTRVLIHNKGRCFSGHRGDIF